MFLVWNAMGMPTPFGTRHNSDVPHKYSPRLPLGAAFVAGRDRSRNAVWAGGGRFPQFASVTIAVLSSCSSSRTLRDTISWALFGPSPPIITAPGMWQRFGRSWRRIVSPTRPGQGGGCSCCACCFCLSFSQDGNQRRGNGCGLGCSCIGAVSWWPRLDQRSAWFPSHFSGSAGRELQMGKWGIRPSAKMVFCFVVPVRSRHGQRELSIGVPLWF
ncbi:uncharacterized protein B0H64DRAFT_89956 [Chaetomium fimeti]|uniref:Uncharacterized protein n=1 Tax=Chaetomium fimeti TaxID=1854472 RepID=A0AAE0HM56_9PEZI|nr:hypothetical protein B0H64DRAFT_89956 [Chaetomium fimeti]